MQGQMLVFPLPALSFLLSVVACALAWRLDLGVPLARRLFVGFFSVVGLGSFLVGLRFGYGVEALIPLQRILPLFVGPLLFLGFAVLTREAPARARLILLHFGVAAVLAIAVPFWLGGVADMDTVIGLSYFYYALRLAMLWRKGANHLTFARLEIAESLRRWSLWGAGFLLLFLVMDTAIAISFALRDEAMALRLISYGSLLLIPALVAAIVVVAGKTAARNDKDAVQTVAEAGEANSEAAAVEAAARAFLTKSQLYLDTELSVERLAKRLHLPARGLSVAINQSCGMNISQYVNGFRLAHAARLLETTDLSVIKVMEQSGFLTRSNFYREFQREYGVSPASYRRSGE